MTESDQDFWAPQPQPRATRLDVLIIGAGVLLGAALIVTVIVCATKVLL